ncbi:MAG: helix-turn-helix transcriptional regulator [Anaerorhabdus sp.]|uniref:helix-turn-helix domain-containing protein n=1 Tax=Anaerorhabdus sp. TaxID=1872524 RepID=UPI002FC9AC95
MEFKDKIKDARLKANKTLEDVGRDCEVSKATVLRWENGEIKDVKRDKISKLAKSLNVSPAYLMDWEEPIKDQYGLDKSKMIEYLSDNQELVEVYKNIVENENLLLLFDKAKDLSESDLKAVLEIINAINKEN